MADHTTPTLLGRLERTYSHIRLVARKLLSLAARPYPESTIDAIAESLTEKMYAHGHGIGIEEAKGLGLRAERMDSSIDSLVWQLFQEYEQALQLQTPDDREFYFQDQQGDVYEEPNAVGVFMETRDITYEFTGDISIRRTRQMPVPLNLNLSMPINLPAGISPTEIPQEVQNTLQRIQAEGAPEIQQIVEAEIARQSPVENIQQKMTGWMWRRTR